MTEGPFDPGDALVATVTFDVAGEPTDPTTITAEVREPDGTVGEYTYSTEPDQPEPHIVRTSVGVYTLTLVPDAAGVWAVEWTGTGAVTAVVHNLYKVAPSPLTRPIPASGIIASAEEVAAQSTAVLSAADLVALEQQIVLYQSELEALLGRGVTMMERVEAVPLPLSHRGDGGDRWHARRGPVHGITSMVAGAVALLSTDYSRNRNGAEVWGGSWVEGTNLVVTYVGGWDYPDNVPARSAVTARALRWLSKRSDDDLGTESSAVEGHSVKWMPDAFTEAELSACSRLRAPDMAG